MQRCEEQLDLALGLVVGSLDPFLTVVLGEVRREQTCRSESDRSGRESLEDEPIPARRARRLYPVVGRALGEMQDLGAVSKRGRTSLNLSSEFAAAPKYF